MQTPLPAQQALPVTPASATPRLPNLPTCPAHPKGTSAVQPTEGERKLVAILVADVVGFSRMIGEDEETALARYARLRRKIINPCITQAGGRVFKELGDGLLVEFPSTVRALGAAVQIQRSIDAFNATQPAPERILLRIGVHQGDVLVQGNDLVGDGVNVAVRIEPLAHPGGICISHRVREDAAGRLNLQFEDIGQHELKNIREKVHLHRVRLSSISAQAAQAEHAAAVQTRGAIPRAAGLGLAAVALALTGAAGVLVLRHITAPPAAEPVPAAATPTPAPASADPVQTASAITRALANTPCALLRATPDARGITITGTAGAGTPEAQARQIATITAGGVPLTWAAQNFTAPYCPVLETIRPAFNAGPLTLSLQGGITAAHEGMVLQPSVGGLDFPAWVRVDSVDASGANYHMYPTLQDRAAGVAEMPARLLSPGLTLSLGQPGDTTWTVAPPLGNSLIVAIAASEQLLRTPRRNDEKLPQYLAALAGAIAQAQGRGARLAADVLVVNLLPK
jgi:class 3 adenylate cyclase